MATVSVTNTDANISGKTIVLAEQASTISGLQTFSRSPSAPFAVVSGSAKVLNLDADKLDGQDGPASAIVGLTDAQNLTNKTLTSAALVSPVVSTSIVSPNQMFAHTCDGRMTLTSGSGVTTADVTAATTVYFTPFRGSNIALYDGSANWTLLPFSELSIAVPATTSQMYDLFVFNNSGTPALEALAWTNDTTRATALVLQNGVLVKTGATTRRYVGSFRTTTVSGQTEDSAAKRYVWNYYNRVARLLKVTDTTDNWVYSTATWRQANNAAANQVDVVVGVAEVLVELQAVSLSSNSVTVGLSSYTGIGEDSLSPVALSIMGSATSGVAGQPCMSTARLSKYTAVGRHFYAWLEQGQNSNTTTWYGDNGALLVQAGLMGRIEG